MGTIGEMEIPIEALTSQVPSYTSIYRGYDSEKKVNKEISETVRGKLVEIIQEYNGNVVLRLQNPLSGEQSSVNLGTLLLTEDKGLVAKFAHLNLID